MSQRETITGSLKNSKIYDHVTCPICLNFYKHPIIMPCH